MIDQDDVLTLTDDERKLHGLAVWDDENQEDFLDRDHLDDWGEDEEDQDDAALDLMGTTYTIPSGTDRKRRWLSTAERERIATRDGWRCHFCGYLIDRDADRRTHPASLAIDHMVPFAMGGSCSATNLRAAHRGCNAIRASRQRTIQDELAERNA